VTTKENRRRQSTECQAPVSVDHTLLTEYESLRKEIADNSTVVAQVFSITFPAVAALIGYGVDKENWVVLLSPYAILLPSLWFVSSQISSTVRLATYIRKFIEPKVTGLKWETRLARLRVQSQDKVSPDKSYLLSITGLYGAVSAVCTILSAIYYWRGRMAELIADTSVSGFDVAWAAANALIVVLAYRVIAFARQCFTSEYIDKLDKHWQETVEAEARKRMRI